MYATQRTIDTPFQEKPHRQSGPNLDIVRSIIILVSVLLSIFLQNPQTFVPTHEKGHRKILAGDFVPARLISSLKIYPVRKASEYAHNLTERRKPARDSHCNRGWVINGGGIHISR